MIATTTHGSDFAGLAAYLEVGRQRVDPSERVAWSAGRNLPTDDPTAAAILMRATADQSRRVEQPVYHLAISAPPGDAVGRAALEAVTDRTLAALGLREHQALLVAHRDKGYAHVHAMVNRVHPATGRVWSRWQDQPIIQRELRRFEMEQGLRETPGRLHQEPHQLPPERPAVTLGERRRAEATGTPPLVERARALLGDIRAAATWQELEARLAQHGIRFETRDVAVDVNGRAQVRRGLVVTDGAERVKASRIAPDTSERQLAQRFGVAYAQRHTVPELPPAVARVAVGVRDLERATRAAGGSFKVATEADAAIATRDRVQRALQQVDVARHRYEGQMARVYVEPNRAMVEFEKAPNADRLRTDPATYGKLVQEAEVRAFGLLTKHTVDGAKLAAFSAASAWQDVEKARAALTTATGGLPPDAAYKDAVARAERATALKSVDQRQRALAGLGPGRVEDLTRSLGAQVAALAAPQLDQLRTVLTRPQVVVLQQIRSMVLGPSQGMHY